MKNFEIQIKQLLLYFNDCLIVMLSNVNFISDNLKWKKLYHSKISKLWNNYLKYGTLLQTLSIVDFNL